MRHLPAFLALTALALPAAAQVTPPQPNTLQPAAATAPGGTAQQNTTGAQKSQAPKQVLEEIGFDPKTKRDPYGNIIGDDKAKEGPKTESQKLRRDSGSSLRSDRKILRKQTTASPVADPATNTLPATTELPVKNGVGAPLVTPQGQPVTVQAPAGAAPSSKTR